jgi:DNA (cytosine-5)-methyltransferase 1
MQENNNTPCCKLHLQDLGVKVELYNVKDKPYFKVFHQEKIIAGSNALCISYDLKGILHLLSHLGTAELADHETLARYIKEYQEEEVKGPRTEYFQKAFQTNIPSKELPKHPTRLNPERQALKHINVQKLKGKLYIPTANSYFSGCGGLDIGLMQAGVNIIQSLDIDKKAIDIMRNNPDYFGHTMLQEDMTEKLLEGQPQTDIMAFTFPCEHYSTSADIHGTRTGDDLFHHAARHVAVRRPPMFIVENVPGMKKFKMVMETLTKMGGYYVYMFCPLDAALWLPQERERLILIATLKPFNIQAPVAAVRRPRIKDIIEKDVEIEVTNTVVNRIKGYYRDMPIIVDPNDPDAIAPCAFAHYEKDQGTRLVKDERYPYGLRPFTVREYARLQGFPDDFKFPDQKTSYRYIGNAVAVDMGRWIGEIALKYFNKQSITRSISVIYPQKAAA